MILAIDPGNIESAYVLMDGYSPVKFGKIDNSELLDMMYVCDAPYATFAEVSNCAIEMIASYGMPVGKEVFDTCVWIGRFQEAIANGMQCHVQYIYRKDEKMNLCGSMRAKDSNIRQALIDRFGVVGTKNAQGWFYGFKKDIWAAYAVGVTHMDSIANERS